MAYIRKVSLTLPASTSPDVAGYKLYWSPATELVDMVGPDGRYMAASIDLGTNLNPVLNDLAEFPKVEGDYNIGLTAYDAVGNESDMLVKNAVPFDMVPPVLTGEIIVNLV